MLKVLVRSIAGVILLAAALLKYQDGPIDGLSLWPHKLLMSFEILLAALLIAGLGGRYLLRFASLCFAAFACVAAYKGLSGAHSCGCFGRMTVPPWVTFTMDLLLALSLSTVFNRAEVMTPYKGLRVGLVVCLVVTAWAVVWWPVGSIHAANAADLNAIGTVSGKIVVLEPEQWVGKPFPLAAVMADSGELMVGQWVVVIYHDGCSTCAEALQQYGKVVAWGESGMPRIALLAIPPESPGRTFPWAQWVKTLPDQWEWFATTPIVVGIQDGRVVRAISGEAAVDATAFIDRLSSSIVH